jgi:hypothetical protein
MGKRKESGRGRERESKEEGRREKEGEKGIG